MTLIHTPHDTLHTMHTPRTTRGAEDGGEYGEVVLSRLSFSPSLPFPTSSQYPRPHSPLARLLSPLSRLAYLLNLDDLDGGRARARGAPAGVGGHGDGLHGDLGDVLDLIARTRLVLRALVRLLPPADAVVALLLELRAALLRVRPLREVLCVCVCVCVCVWCMRVREDSEYSKLWRVAEI